ncbi:unnamed protein product, partial [Ascophyllum nodosum]
TIYTLCRSKTLLQASARQGYSSKNTTVGYLNGRESERLPKTEIVGSFKMLQLHVFLALWNVYKPRVSRVQLNSSHKQLHTLPYYKIFVTESSNKIFSGQVYN